MNRRLALRRLGLATLGLLTGEQALETYEQLTYRRRLWAGAEFRPERVSFISDELIRYSAVDVEVLIREAFA